MVYTHISYRYGSIYAGPLLRSVPAQLITLRIAVRIVLAEITQGCRQAQHAAFRATIAV